MSKPMKEPDRTAGEDAAFDELVYEVSARIEAGELVDPEALAQAHPQHAQRLRKLLPTLQAVAELGHSPTRADGEPAEAPSSNGRVPSTLGDFRIVREVGRGGMGVVYEAEQVSLKRRVALKVLPFAAVLDQRQLQRFKNEAQAAAMLHHQNIVPIYSVGCERGVHFYAMQFIDGHTLGELIGQLRQATGLSPEGRPGTTRTASKTAPPKPRPAATTLTLPQMATTASTTQPAFFRSVAQLGAQVAEALDHAHQQGIVHRDIKPSNLMVDARGKPWITDFGLAHVEAGPSLTVSGDLLGTLRYMSPEQALAKRVVIDHRSDIYSLGVTLYELLTLRPVFGGKDRRELLRQIAFEEPRPPRKLSKAIPTDLETIILKAIAKNPAERYATAQELADDLRRFLDVKPIRARRPTVLQRSAKWARRQTPLVWSAAALLVMATVGSLIAATLVWKERQKLRQANIALTEARDEAKRQEKLAKRRETEAKASAKLAKDNLELALDALDEVFVRVTESKLSGRVQDEREWNAALLRDVLRFYGRLARANLVPPKRRPTVERAYRKLISLWENLAGSMPDAIGYRRHLATARLGFAAFLQATQRAQEAERMQRASLAQSAELARGYPSVPEYQQELADSHSAMAALLETQQRNQEAEDERARAVKIRRGFGPNRNSVGAVRFPDFSDTAGFAFAGDAAPAENRLRLTPASAGTLGAAWLREKQWVAAGFDITFSFRTTRNIGAGFAFVVQNHGPSALGCGGSGNGYGGGEGPSADIGEGIRNSLAVEFDHDTHRQLVYSIGEHIAVHTGGTSPNRAHPA